MANSDEDAATDMIVPLTACTPVPSANSPFQLLVPVGFAGSEKAIIDGVAQASAFTAVFSNPERAQRAVIARLETVLQPYYQHKDFTKLRSNIRQALTAAHVTGKTGKEKDLASDFIDRIMRALSTRKSSEWST
jgi:hypothetical protein